MPKPPPRPSIFAQFGRNLLILLALNILPLLAGAWILYEHRRGRITFRKSPAELLPWMEKLGLALGALVILAWLAYPLGRRALSAVERSIASHHAWWGRNPLRMLVGAPWFLVKLTAWFILAFQLAIILVLTLASLAWSAYLTWEAVRAMSGP